MLETAKDSRRLCPGTPSNVFFCASFSAAFARSSAAAFAFACASVTIGLGRTGLGGVAPSMRIDAARVMRGGIDGANVEATGIDSVRLWPGTFANMRWSASLDGGVRGLARSNPIVLGGVSTPERRSAARVVRGTMVGETWEAGISRALKGVRWEVLLLLLLLFVCEALPGGEWVTVVAVVVVAVVVVVRVVGGRWEEGREDEKDRRESEVRACPSVEKSSGRAEVGNGGEETKRDAICISAVSTSGEPMTAFCSLLMP